MDMAAAQRDLEDSCPSLREEFQADLALLAEGTSAASRLYAADARVIARLAAQIPRVPGDESGPTAWTSFRREIALSRKVSDRAAAAQIRAALRLTTVLPHAMALLEAGVLTVPRAIAFVTELEGHDDELAAVIDAELADKAVLLPAWRIEQEVRRAVLRHDPDAAAQRTAQKTAGRGVSLLTDRDDQATACLTGPAVPLQRWYATLDAQARALKQAGDPRTLDALRFDLATSTYPCDVHSPTDPTAPTAGSTISPTADAPAGSAASAVGGAAGHATTGQDRPAGAHCAPPAGSEATPDDTADLPVPAAAAGLRSNGVEAASTDCRRSRPVQVKVVVPVETSLGLSNEPGWLEGYGWISAPTCRQLLVDAELRKVCAQTGTGLLVDIADRDVRPPPTPSGVRDALLSMVLDDVVLDDVGWRSEPQHDPSDRLREHVVLRDRFCDGPTGARVGARRAELDHDDPWPHGPTAAWNLAARSQRTHQLKHCGWTPLRTATGTLWLSPAGQLAEVPRHTNPPPGIDATDAFPSLPDPDELAHVDRQQLTAPHDSAPWLPRADRDDKPEWTWLPTHEPVPF